MIMALTVTTPKTRIYAYLGKETYWLSKNEKYVSGVYVMLEETKMSNN